jgi:lipopolysaccharide export system protein LptC
MDRLTNWSPVLLLGGLAALTYWLDAQIQPREARRDGSARHDPDLFVERFRAIAFDVEGRVRQSLTAERARHFPDDNSIEFAALALAVTDPGSPRMAVNADAGTLSGDRETLVLAGRVRAVRDATPAAPKAAGKKGGEEPSGPVTLATEYLRVIPKQGRATTDKEVTIEEPRGIIRAVGMELDTQAKTLKLKSAVRGSLQPQPSAK